MLSVSARIIHCLAVTEEGGVFSWGDGLYGQCGHGSSRNQQLLPRRVEALTGVWARSALAGFAHSLVGTEEGALYSFGTGSLGHGCVDDEQSPRMVDALPHVLSHTSTHQRWYGFLSGQQRQRSIGHGCRGASEFLLLRVDALSGIRVSSMATEATANCTVSGVGELFTWGYGRAGRLGHGDASGQHAPRRVAALQGEWLIAVSPGVAHTVAVTRCGSVFGLGIAKRLVLSDTASKDVHGVVFSVLPSRYLQLLSERIV